MSYEERPCLRCDRGRILRADHPMARPTWGTCQHCKGTGTVSVFVYPRRKRRVG